MMTQSLEAMEMEVRKLDLQQKILEERARRKQEASQMILEGRTRREQGGFTCPACGEMFNSARHMSLHMKANHPDAPPPSFNLPSPPHSAPSLPPHPHPQNFSKNLSVFVGSSVPEGQ